MYKYGFNRSFDNTVILYGPLFDNMSAHAEHAESFVMKFI